MHPKTFKQFRSSLLDWYHINRRNLPWRNIDDPYRIWVSEIILQQTTVEQGLSYYLRFIETFKTVYELAAAPEQDVLKLWQGLGYYSRARNMHHAAQTVVNSFEGRFPDNHSDIIKLKGIGPYTAAAILSFAFNKPYPVLDGNVIRVVSRLFGIEDPVDSSKGLNQVKESLNLLFDTQNPADFNQAIMEFGATHCRQRNPLCEECLAKPYCVGFQNNIVSLLPVKSKSIAVRQRYFIYYVPLMSKDGNTYTFLKKRTGKDIWQNMYDFILFEKETPFNPESFFKSDSYKDFVTHHNLPFKAPQKTIFISPPVVHKLTHQTINTFFIIAQTPDFVMPSAFQKVKTNELNTFPLPKLVENFIEKLKNKNIPTDLIS